mmetsp:Transcript_39256/g.84519  ORF Transcript_39256/g.84519 Transcript_39256/m.84519 type:complete len:93 (+) Transcript_39256:335-613(+)
MSPTGGTVACAASFRPSELCAGCGWVWVGQPAEVHPLWLRMCWDLLNPACCSDGKQLPQMEKFCKCYAVLLKPQQQERKGGYCKLSIAAEES